MEEEIRRLKKWAGGEKQPPIGIELAPTLRCNLNCKFCWRRKESFSGTNREMKNREMNLGKYRKIIREGGEMGVEEVKIIGGGEPFFREEILSIMKEVKKNDIWGYVCTNGSLLTSERIERLVDMGWDYVKVSLHGLGDKHNELVEGDVFESTVESLRILADSPVETEIGMVVVDENYKDIGNLLDLVKDLGIDHLFLEPITVYSKLGEELRMNDKQQRELAENLEELDSVAGRYDVNTNFCEFVDNNLVESTNSMKDFILSRVDEESDSFTEIPCYEPFLRMGIRVDGRVAPCGFYDEKRGDSIRNKSLEEVWFGNYFEERRQEQMETELPDYCSKCCTTLVNKQRRIGEKLGEVL